MDVKFLLFSAFILGGLTGCTSQPVQHKPIVGNIVNYSKSSIKTIYFQECDAPQNEWSVFLDNPIETGKRTEIPLDYPCMNLRAVDQNGKDVGKQWGIKNIYPFLWQIQ